jgi:hypothetical protein
MDNVIDIHNVLEYYGDINLNILEDVIHLFPNTTHFEFEGKQYGTTDEELHKITTHWSKMLRG